LDHNHGNDLSKANLIPLIPLIIVKYVGCVTSILRPVTHCLPHLWKFVKQIGSGTVNQIRMTKLTQKILGDWNITKKKLKQKFVSITESDVSLIKGKHEELVNRLQVRLGKTKEEIIKLISDL
jgi:uncharacterized protein YjbJ (UPF0337 family)